MRNEEKRIKNKKLWLKALREEKQLFYRARQAAWKTSSKRTKEDKRIMYKRQKLLEKITKHYNLMNKYGGFD